VDGFFNVEKHIKKIQVYRPPSLENQMVVALLMTQSDLDKPDTISYTVYNCPNTEKYRVNKIHIGRGS
jgi:hypothetical protein